VKNKVNVEHPSLRQSKVILLQRKVITKGG